MARTDSGTVPELFGDRDDGGGSAARGDIV